MHIRLLIGVGLLGVGPSTAFASTILSGEVGDHFGGAVSAAGDVNGDGYADVVVGADEFDAYTGRIYFFLGSSTGVASVASLVVEGPSVGSDFGCDVAGAGDVDGDGYADVIVGAVGLEQALLYLGSAAGLSSTPDLILESPVGGDRFGVAVASAGDVNGDGFGDVIVGTEGGSAAHVYLGSSSGLDSTPDATLTSATGESFGDSVGGAGDVDGDGYDDVIVGAPTYGASDGRAYVFLGSSAGLTTTVSATLEALVGGGGFGGSVAAAGDVDADGFGDVIVGTWAAGEAYVFLGAADGLSSVPATTLVEGDPSELLGRAVSGAGDVNADGYADVIVGQPAGAYDLDSGRAYVYFGSAVGLDTAASRFLDGEDWGDALGDAVDGAGDVDGDGDDDVIAGAPVGGDGGWAYVVTEPTDVDGDGYAWPGDCDDMNASVHPLATEICDPGDVDEDCDGLVDDADPSVTAQSTGYVDTDGDGYGGATAVVACDLPDGTPTESTDCDDSAANIHPGAPESSCTDPVDYNCDGSAGVEDIDGDGFTACRDCNDADPAYHPRAPETDCADPNDYNCDGSVGATDADGDGYPACEECDDAIGGINPGSVERCDGMDNDCDDTVDLGAYDSPTWFADADGDGYTDLGVSVVACEPPAGYLQGTPDDCDDADDAVNPGAEDIPDDGVDQDCDGSDAVGDPSVDDTGVPTDTGNKDPGGCGCVSGDGDGVGAGMMALVAVVMGRRRRG